MQIEHFILTRMAMSKKTVVTRMQRNWRLHWLLVDCEIVQPPLKTIWQFLKSLNTELQHDQAILTPRYIHKRNKNIHPHKNLYMNGMVNCFFEVLGPGSAPAETQPCLSFISYARDGSICTNIMMSIAEVYPCFTNQTPFILNLKLTRLNYYINGK